MISRKQIYTILTSGIAISAPPDAGTPGHHRGYLLCVPPIRAARANLMETKNTSLDTRRRDGG